MGFPVYLRIPLLAGCRICWQLLGAGACSPNFPNCCGVEQELIDRCVGKAVADRFIQLVREYASRANAVGSGFDMNPSPGNIRDGSVTDAMKSAGAARKGGASPVTAVLDYPEYSTAPGLNLQCTPGNDVECVTAQVGAGANLVLFTTGLGTPTGNPIAPVLKISTNSPLAQRMQGIIDIDTGAVISGESTIARDGETHCWSGWLRWRAAGFELRQSCSGRATSFPGREASPSDEMPRLQPMR